MAPAGVLRHQGGFETRDGALHLREVLAIDTFGGTQAQADAVQAERIVRARALERAPGRAAFVEIVFGVRLYPADRRTFGGERVLMNGTKADSGTCRNR